MRPGRPAPLRGCSGCG
ncbi:phage DNA packaging protein J [Nocardioides sp.]